MPTFKVVVLKHQKRADGKYPVSVRITNLRRSVYLSTGLRIGIEQINTRTFEVKDRSVIDRVNSMIDDVEKALGCLSLNEVNSMSAESIKRIAQNNWSTKGVDVLEFMRANSRESISIGRICGVFERLGYHRLRASDIRPSLMKKVRAAIDEMDIVETTKRNYFSFIVTCINKYNETFSTDFSPAINGNYMLGVRGFQMSEPKTKDMPLEMIAELYARRAEMSKADRRNITMCLISFTLCGMNIQDLLELEWSRYKDGKIVYNRRKVRKRSRGGGHMELTVPAITERLIEEVCERGGKFVFRQSNYSDAYAMLNYSLRHYVTGYTYYSIRRAWATVAYRDCKIRRDVVDKALGHSTGNKMVDCYIKDYFSDINEANAKVCEEFERKIEEYINKKIPQSPRG